MHAPVRVKVLIFTITTTYFTYIYNVFRKCQIGPAHGYKITYLITMVLYVPPCNFGPAFSSSAFFTHSNYHLTVTAEDKPWNDDFDEDDNIVNTPLSSIFAAAAAVGVRWLTVDSILCVTSVARFNRRIDLLHPSVGEQHQDFYSIDLNYTCPPSPWMKLMHSSQCAHSPRPVSVVADARSIFGHNSCTTVEPAIYPVIAFDCIFTNSIGNHSIDMVSKIPMPCEFLKM